MAVALALGGDYAGAIREPDCGSFLKCACELLGEAGSTDPLYADLRRAVHTGDELLFYRCCTKAMTVKLEAWQWEMFIRLQNKMRVEGPRAPPL